MSATGKSKPFGPALADGWIHDPTIRALAGAPAHIKQFETVTMAPSKAAAVRYLAAVPALHRIANPNRLSVRAGKAIDALTAAGLLVDDGSTIVYHRYVKNTPILRLRPDAAPEIAAHFAPHPVSGDVWPIAVPVTQGA